MKNKSYISVLLIIAFSITGCNDMNDIEKVRDYPTEIETTQIFVLCEGLFNLNNSTLASYNFEKQELNTNFFLSSNNRGLGDTANDMQLYGSKLYVVVNVSSEIEVLDINTGKSIKQIPMFDEKGVARQPRFIDFLNGKAYVCSFDGTVVQIDTTTLEINAVVECGRNPDGICVANNKVYVSNSGGLDFPYFDSTVSVLNTNPLKEIKKITVGLNPYKIHSDKEGDVYVVTRGNYGDIPYSFKKINSNTDEVVKTFSDIQALNFTICNDTAYIYNYDYALQTSWFKVFDCKQEKIVSENFITDNTTISTPYGINVNPANGDVYITDAYSFTEWGDVLCFNRSGKLKFRINQIGLNPNQIVFINKIK
ncbi:MAG: hypothetical protein PHS59_12450 [Paludibacter sp.]|nr:hypothetical protein [Paludibacter sp.]